MRFFATLLVCACARARCLQSGDLYATNPETGAVTIMHTSFVNATTEHTNQPGPVVPINSGDPHTYFPGHEMSPRRVRRPYEGAGLDSVTESPQEATFRRHFKMFKKYLGTDGEDPYTAAYRIWAMHPSMSTGMEPEEDEEEEEDEGAAAEDEGAAAEDVLRGEGGAGGPPGRAARTVAGAPKGSSSSPPGVASDCHFAVQLDHFVPGFLSYSVAVFLK